jgi:hypothetical protein
MPEYPERVVPPTVRDPARRRTGVVVAIVAASLLLLAAGAGAWLYFAWWYFEPAAHLHVPEGTNVAVRTDGKQLYLFKPFRQHIWPLVEGLEQGSAKGRIDRIRKATGIQLPTDLREVIVAAVDPETWVVLASGKYPKGRFVRGMHKVLRDEGVSGWTLQGELLVHALGPALGQASDGTLILGSSAGVATAALPAASTVRVPVPVDGAVSFLVNHEAWSGAVSLLPLTLPGLETLSRIEEASGTMTLTDQPTLALSLKPKEGVDAPTLAGDLDRLLTTARRFTLLVPNDLGGAKDAMREATIEPKGGKVSITAPWPYDAIDRSMARAAELLRALPVVGVPAPAASGPSAGK